jgi:hypothetical protein
MTANEDRVALAQAWLEHWALHSELWNPTDYELAEEYADALLPTVDAIASRRTAAELRAAANLAPYACRDHCRARAAELDGGA